MPRGAFVLKIQRELCHPKYAQKVSGLSRNRPQVCCLPVAEKFDPNVANRYFKLKRTLCGI